MLKNKLLLFLVLIPVLCYNQNIKTIQFKPLNSNSFQPIVTLGNTLELSFDDLDADNKEYQYEIKHMTHNWEPSDLIPNQYINGYEKDYIINTTNSFNTLQDYTHYKLQIPNQNTIITKSGNYLVTVFNEDDEVVFTRRCIFYENSTTVGVAVFRGRDLNALDKQQTVQLTVAHADFSFANPNQEVTVAILQNNNWATLKNNLKPLFFKPYQLIYNYTDITNFWGGNEFLNFDTKNIRNANLNIANVERKKLFHNYLYTNEPRENKRYTYNPDINGEFKIRSLEADDENTEADYSFIHFSLDATNMNIQKEIYIQGGFNNYSFSKENKMVFNKEKNSFEASILLKQGFYNYNFTTLNTDTIPDLHEIDGSFYETENEYTAIVYYRAIGAIYDRVIGVGKGFFDQNR